MSMIATLSTDRALLEAVRGPSCARRSVASTASWDRLIMLLRERPVTCAVVDARAVGRAGGLVGTVATLRSQFPSVAQVMVVGPETDAHGLLRLGRAGVENLVMMDLDLLDVELERALGRSTRYGATALVRRAVSPYVPAREADTLRMAMEAVPDGWDAERFSGRIGLSRPHLSVRLSECGLPTTGHLMVWARLLHAGRWLADPGRTAESVSRQLEYSSGSAFRRALKNYTGATPTEVIDAGGFYYVLRRFMESCTFDWRRTADRSVA